MELTQERKRKIRLRAENIYNTATGKAKSDVETQDMFDKAMSAVYAGSVDFIRSCPGAFPLVRHLRVYVVDRNLQPDSKVAGPRDWKGGLTAAPYFIEFDNCAVHIPMAATSQYDPHDASIVCAAVADRTFRSYSLSNMTLARPKFISLTIPFDKEQLTSRALVFSCSILLDYTSLTKSITDAFDAMNSQIEEIAKHRTNAMLGLDTVFRQANKSLRRAVYIYPPLVDLLPGEDWEAFSKLAAYKRPPGERSEFPGLADLTTRLTIRKLGL